MKMSYGHRLTILFLIFVAVSFLFSCGIPTYWEPSNSTVISKNSISEDNTIGFKVNVTYYPEDAGENSPKIGLLLLYTFSNSVHTSTIDTELVKTFNSNYRGTIPNGLNDITAMNNTPLWSFTKDDESYDVFAFTDSSGNAVGAYKYNKDISSSSNISTDYTLKFVSINDGINLYVSSSSIVDSNFKFGLESTNLENLEESGYIHVYAAISAQSNNYSNLYWSNLVYVGSFDNN